MKNKKKKFIVIIVLFILFILGIEIYKTYIVSGIDRNSYVILNSGVAKLNDNNLIINKKEKLKAKDKIETIGESSLAIIKWGDGSVTRLGGDSVLIINESQIDKDLLNIKIDFSLEKGKTWSDIISFIGKDSYFHQSFADTTAAVRGTIYEVNLDKDYVYVEKHEVILQKKSGEKKIIPEKKPFIISKFNFTYLIKFINDIKDSAWQKLNIQLDSKFYSELKRNLKDLNNNIEQEILQYKEEISNLDTLDEKQKQELYDRVLSKYQELKFISPSDTNLYNTKLELKEELLKLSDSKDKEMLLITSIYDIDELIKNKNFEALNKNFQILSNNKYLLNNLNLDFNNYINLDLLKNIEFPEGLKNEFINSFENIKNNLNLKNLNIDTSVTDTIKAGLENSFENLKDNISKIKNNIND